eukprot:TRINITY_DN5070_c0_g1_i4.p1 TRINITY_DN5070_c0_g1~~TRINITY_DN5070_c0_g1_i4.p1  ORF type:complete len:323 (+),score=155.40 TRINITY_DN5070_c0_g1_i4:398-1366(+)
MMINAPTGSKAKARAKAAATAGTAPGKPKVPELGEYVDKRDYTGALALLEFNRRSGDDDNLEDMLLWIGYCAFHVGRYQRALEAYEEVVAIGAGGGDVHLYVACCHYYLQSYDQAEEAASRGPKGPLRTRLLLHIAHKQNDERKLMQQHQELSEKSSEDQLSLAAIHYLRSHFQEATAAEESLLLIQSERYKQDYVFISWLARCYMMNGNPRNAWELYLKMETSNESFNLLQLIANDCYRMGHFLYAAKAFDVLERLDPEPEYWEGKRGACVGVFQLVIAGKASKEDLRDALAMVRNTSNPQVEYMVRVIKKWAKDNGIKIP